MTATAPLCYRVRIQRPERQHYTVELRIANPARRQTVSLPVWIPGSYLVREFARNLNHLTATQGRTQLRVEQLDKSSWAIAADPARILTLRYEVHAADPSVRAAWLDDARGFFNGTSLLLRVHDQEDQPHELEVLPPASRPDWQLATAMAPLQVDRRGFGRYGAADYDELVDHPVELGAFWSGRFEARGLPHRFVVAGAPPGFDGDRLLRDTQKICETIIGFWHGRGRPQRGKYVFMLNATQSGYGGIEHRASSALICSRADLPHQPSALAQDNAKGYESLLGVISHEYFHAWNVKRLRPAEFTTFDYNRENHTELLWFFEGFTSYYDDLLLHRAGLVDEAAYFKRIARALNQTLQAPGRFVQSVAQASFDAWTRFYRPDAHTPNSTISYYGKGALVALCLDLTLRREGRTTLDHVMRALWKRCRGGPMAEDDVRTVLAELGERPFDDELNAWVHGTDDLPLPELLAAHGVDLVQKTAPLAQSLGLRVREEHGVHIRIVLDGGAAAATGMAAGDEWLGVEPASTRRKSGTASGWRLQRLEDLPLYAGTATRVTALVARDGRLLRLPLTLPQPGTQWHLARREGAELDSAWPAP